MIHNYSGKSLNELYALYRVGKGGFLSHWWEDENFADEKAPKGNYELNIENKSLINLAYDEQVKKLPKGWEVPHPAVIAEALLAHFKETGEYLMEDWYSRVSLVASDGLRVVVGSFDSDGLSVSGWDGSAGGSIGLSSARKSEKNIENRKNWEEVKTDALDSYRAEFGTTIPYFKQYFDAILKSAIQSYENATKVEEDNHYGDEGLRSDRTFNAAIAIREEKIKEFWEEK